MSDSIGLRFLYKTHIGRLILKGLVKPSLSIRVGKFLDSPNSTKLIKGFIENNCIDMSEYEEANYKSFNDFFTRKVKVEARPVSFKPEEFIAPCDGNLSIYKIKDGLIMPIKQSKYTVNSLLQNEALASYYKDGYALVFRLCVDNYHRYHYVDNCIKSDNYHIDGVLHTVRPIALENTKVFCENTREYTIMKTENFGGVTQIEIGAMLVGKIVNNHKSGRFKRGDEKGMFNYGGSTIVLLVESDVVEFDEDIIKNTQERIETPILFGEKIGIKI